MDSDTADAASISSRNGPEGTPATDSIVLEEEIDPNYVPSEEEVIEYAKWLGMDLEKDKDLYWVAREGLMAPLPKNWKPCKTKDTEDIYYFNFSSGASTWDHPCDGYYKSLYEEEKKKKEISMKERNDQQRNKAKQDVEELLGKGEKKKKKKSTSLGDINGPSKNLGPLGGLASLERKPLPGINMQGMHGQTHMPRSWTESTGNVRDSISVRDSDDFKDSGDRDGFRIEPSHSSGSPDRDSTDGKTRRRQRDSSGPMLAAADTQVSSRVVRSSDVSRRAASINKMEQERRGSISDKGRRGEVGPHKDGEFVNYSSETDSDSSNDCRSVRSVRSNLSPQDVPRKVVFNTTRHENSEAKSTELNDVRVADRGNNGMSERDRERERERERSNLSKGEWDRIPQERETIRSRSNVSGSGNGASNSSSSATAGSGSERSAGGAESKERERDVDETTYVEEFRNYSDDETVDLPQSERRALLESRSGSRGRAYADEEKSGSGSSFNTMSSGNDLSMSDMAGMKKRSGTSGLLIDALGTSSSSGKGRGSVTTQEEHQEDMQAKRLLWQQEVEFHESNVRRQRAAMVLENERVEEENAKMTSQRSPQQSARIAHTSSDSPASPNVTSDLRLKLRDLESEMEEMKARNILLENEKNDALRAAKREKEAAISSQSDARRLEGDLNKQLKLARGKANTLEEERNKLETDISLLRSELKKKSSVDLGSKVDIPDSTQGPASAASGGAGLQSDVSAKEREEEKKTLLANIKALEKDLSREKEAKAAMTAEVKASERTHEQQLKKLKEELGDATDTAASLRASLEKTKSGKGKDTAADDLRQQLEQKTRQLEAMNKKLDDVQAESESREGVRTTEKLLSDQRTRQLNEEIEVLTTSVESGLSKCRRAEQQLLFSQDDAADKELRYQQSRQSSAALQKRCDEAESEVLVWRGKCKSDAVQSDATVEDLNAQLVSMKAAKAVVESLLLSSGDDDDLERSELLAKISKLNIELASERSAVADRDALANSLKLEQVELQRRADLLDASQSRVATLEAELQQHSTHILASQAELAALNGRTQNSESTSKRVVADLQQQIAFLTASNVSLSERVEHKLAEVQSLTESMLQLQELLALTERNLEESSQLCNELREQLEREKSKTRLLQQTEDERDHHRKSFSSSEENARELEAVVSKLTADLSKAQATVAAQAAAEKALNATDNTGLQEKLAAMVFKLESLASKNTELESNIKFVSERERTQSTALLSLQATHRKSLQEIESMSVQLRVTSSKEVEEKEKELHSLQQGVHIERNQHQKVLSSLHEVLKSKELEISTLKGDKVALVRLAEKSSLIPHTVAVDEGSIGIAALSVIVGQQQTSVQRLQEKLESTEGLILALTQALPSQVQAQQSKPQTVVHAHVAQESPKRQKKAAVAVSARGRRRLDADNDSEGESERKASSSADYHRYDKMTPSGLGSVMGRRGAESELEKDLLLSPEWPSHSDSEVKRYPAQHRNTAKADSDTRNSWSKIPTRHDTVGPSRSPIRSRPRQKEKEKEREKERDRDAPQVDTGLESWALKIARENRFLDDLMATLKDEKLSVRKEQEVLGKRRAAWRMKKASNPKDSAGKAELREESSDLNAQTTRLNDAVEQTRVMHGFLTERRRKLDALKEYMLQLSVSNESSQRTRSKGAQVQYREDEAELTLEVMERLGRELDSEAEVTLHEYGYSSSVDDFYVGSNAYSHVGQPDRHRNVRQSHDPSPTMHDRLYQQNLQTMSQHQNNAIQGNGPSASQIHSQGGKQYLHQQYPPSYQQQVPMKGFYPSNQGQNSFDPRGDLIGYDNQYSQVGYSHPSSAYLQHRQRQGSGSGQSQLDDYYMTSSSPPRMAVAVDDPARWAQPASSVRFNLGIKGISGDVSASFPYTDRGVNAGVKDPRAIRDQLKDLTNRRAQTTEAFDTHASWLNNLQAEIGRFSHGKGDRSDMPSKQKQQKGPSFTAFMASQGPPMCAEERFSTNPADLEKDAAQL